MKDNDPFNYPDYARLDYYQKRHRERYKDFVESLDPSLMCQDCCGRGGETVPILDDGTGPWEECGWCEGTGLVTPWNRGYWLRYKKAMKKENKSWEQKT